ncbi:hypothetical protein [Pseudomonas sp. F3-2]|uniref:hypothetical protein n=1 Tax=Pseudomonas sp. F3-2 TaxID=3141539 RepID=UPI00315CC1C6
MSRSTVSLVVRSLSLGILLAASVASADTSSSARGVLPLKHGVFVSKGQSCADPANAGIKHYDGKGVHGSATHLCLATVIEHKGNHYTVDQSCIDTPAGDGPRVTARENVTVHDARNFTWGTGDKAVRYRYCPESQLPDWLRQ